MNEAPGHSAGPLKATPESVADLRWRQVFPGDERQIRTVRRWLAGLLPPCSSRDDVIAVAVELATNAVKFSSSGRGGSFAVEVTWHGAVVRVAVADGGAPEGPRLIDDPLGDHGRGLLMVRALSVRTGVCGDHRGRLVWAEIAWTGDREAVPLPSADGYEAAIRDGQAALARRFVGVPAWFGRSTLQWWALPSRAGGDRLLSAPSARELAGLLDQVLNPPPRPPRMAVDPGAARAGDRASVPVALVPPRIHQARRPVPRLGAQPC